MTDEDLSDVLSPEQKQRLAAELENQLLVKPPIGRKFTRAADAILRAWAKKFNSTDGKEMKRDTGNVSSSTLGREMKRASGIASVYENTDAGLELSDNDFDYIQTVMATMSSYNRMFLFAHYLKRPAVLAKLFETTPQYTCEKDTAYRARVEKLYYPKIGLTKPTYGRYLKDARYEFMVRGGLQ